MPESFDVIVVGAGGSGLAAACSACERGARVLVLEKRPQPGGTTGIAVGSYTAAGTSLQRAAGVIDDAAAHAEDAGRFADPAVEARNSPELRQFFLEEAAASFEWLRGLGLTFVGPSPEPPNRQPRMHNVVPGAKAYIAALQLALHRLGAELRCEAVVNELRWREGRIAGVRATWQGQSREWEAKRGVVLAAGDYAASASLIAAHKGAGYQEIEGINPYAEGDGHRLAASVGAQLLNMDVTYGPELRFVASRRRPFQQWLPVHGPAARLMAVLAPRLPRFIMQAMIKRLLVTWQHPENSLFDDGAILVNRDAVRFCEEYRWPDREIAVAQQPGKIAFLLLDGYLVERYSRWPHFVSTAPDIAYAYVQDYRRLRPDVTAWGTTLEAVGRERGLNPARLRRTVDDLRASRAASNAGRVALSQLDRPPWVLLGPLKAYFTTTEGGAAINRRMQVLDGAGQVIPGLYAVGQNGLGGMILWGHGLHIAWAITSGRLAGQAIMS
ncbi:MAG: FAD-dependent oxidoreductase [Pirellulaceae bacterium]